jgi:chromosome segregation protein
MYLSRIELFGFKSFAQRTIVEFSSGVTCVVGPNGCGKTNILDAVRWVLGEQKSSTLRSERMESVIFNGSKHRKPLALAEVSLVIENSRGILPLDYSEILLTRRLYRSGESEYLMNRQPCRLKDINDLFMDTGMGPGSYSVIELKMVEDLLSDRPEERRHLFEEAAGVTKYKHRRRAALRRLEETRQHILRLEDVVAEAERQVSGLRRQVRRTERHRELLGELRVTDLRLAGSELARSEERLGPLRGQAGHSRLEAARLERDLAAMGAEGTALDKEVLLAGEALQQAEDELRERQRLSRALEEEALVGRERLAARSREMERMEREVAELRPRLAESSGRQGESEARLTAVLARRAVLEGEQQAAAAAADEAADRLEQTRLKVESLRARVLAVLGQQARCQSEIARTGAALENLRRQLADEERDGAAARADQARRQEERRRREGELAAAEAAESRAREELEQARGRQEQAREERLLAERHSQDLAAERRALDGRRRLLGQLLSRFEGLPGGARAVLEAGCAGIVDALGNLVHAGPERLRALEAVLGEAAHWLVAEDEAAVERAAARLEQAGKGGCTFVVLDRVPTLAPRPVPPGCEALAEGLKAAPSLRPLLELLLADVWLCEDPAAQAARHPHGGALFVAADGRWQRPPHLWRRGPRAAGDESSLGLRVQLGELEAEAAVLGQRGDELAALEDRAREALAQAEARRLRAAQVLSEAGAEVQAGRRRLERLAYEDERFVRDEERTRRAAAQLQARIDEAALREASLKTELQARLAEKEEAESDAAALAGRLERLGAELRQRVEARDAAQLALAEQRLAAESEGRELERLQRFLREGRQRAETLERELLTGAQERASLQQRREELEGEQLLAGEARQRSQAALDQAKSALQELHQRQRQRQSAERELNQRRETLREAGHRAELEIREIEGRMATLKERIRVEHGLELVACEPLPGDEAAAAARRTAELRDALQRLGPVNLLAEEEYETERQRHEFLARQLRDLLEAEAMLKETIGRINRVARELFEETFSKIRQNFEYLFRKLFEDGRADLQLAADDPLEAEIQISASPSGKRIQNLMQMSGGEKTLTAIALLFGIYMVKPSPFCILDEVDAPLDDSNIARFNTIIQEFSGMTQFIVITHNKKTMGYADQLYGVTMAEEGVSSLVAVRFQESAAS